MKKALLCFSFFAFFVPLIYAGNQNPDSLLTLIGRDQEDTNKINHLNTLAISYCGKGKTDTALQMENSAVELALQLNYSKGLGAAYNNIATAYFIKKDYKNTLIYFQKAMKVYEDMGEKGKAEVAGLTASIGFIYEAQGDYSTAMDYYNRSLKMAKTLGDKKQIAIATGNIGNIYSVQGDEVKAMDCYLKALELKEQIGDKHGIIKSASNIATHYKDQGDYAKAMDYYSKALKTATEVNDLDLEANTYVNIGDVYRQEGDLKNALDNEFKALNIADSLQYKPLMASANSTLGLIFFAKADYSKALGYYTTAFNLYQETGDKSTEATILGDMGIVCETQGDYPKALDYELKSLKLCDELGDKNGATVCTGNIGDIYMKQQKYKDAEKYILQALYLADTIHLLESIKESNLELSELFTKTGQWEKAYDAYKQYGAAKDSLFKQTKKEQLYKLESKANFEQAMALQKEKEDEASALEAIKQKNRSMIFAIVGFVLLSIAIVAAMLYRMQIKLDKRKEALEKELSEKEKQDSPTLS